MKKWLVRFLAGIGFLALLSTGFSLWLVWQFAMPKHVALPEKMVLSIALDGNFIEYQPMGGFGQFLPQEPSLREVIAALDAGAKDDRVKGLIARIGSLQIGLARTQELYAALQRFRQSGKFTYVFSDSFGEGGGGNLEYWLASGFDQIWLQPLGEVGINGFAMEIPYGRTALDKIGVGGEFTQREEYKGLFDSLTEQGMNDQVRAANAAFVADLQAQMVSSIAARGFTPEQVISWVASAPITDKLAAEAKLVSQLGYRDEMKKAALAKAGDGAEITGLLDYGASASKAPDGGAQVAVLYLQGAISREQPNSSMHPTEGSGAITMANAIEEAVKAGNQAIIVRIDSPGGSPAASETIRRALEQAREKGVRVIISMGDVAASGGYWIATAGEYIVAQPGTITGSIGVAAGKFLFGDLSNRLGIRWEQVLSAPNAGLMSSFRSFTPEQRAEFEAGVDRIYAGFLERVSKSRKLSISQARAVARGRIWTGQQAKANGLVDELGGLDAALNAARRGLKLSADAPLQISYYPAADDSLAALFGMLGNHLSLSFGAFSQQLFGYQSRMIPFRLVD